MANIASYLRNFTPFHRIRHYFTEHDIIPYNTTLFYIEHNIISYKTRHNIIKNTTLFHIKHNIIP